jgi:hypothetical protein
VFALRKRGPEFLLVVSDGADDANARNDDFFHVGMSFLLKIRTNPPAAL